MDKMVCSVARIKQNRILGRTGYGDLREQIMAACKSSQ
jgi:hypothetical protein